VSRGPSATDELLISLSDNLAFQLTVFDGIDTANNFSFNFINYYYAINITMPLVGPYHIYYVSYTGLKFILRFTDFSGCRSHRLDFVHFVFFCSEAKEMIRTAAATFLLVSGKTGHQRILQIDFSNTSL